MSLPELLKAKKIARAVVVDDVVDSVPKADDIGTGNEAWFNFNDDLTAELREVIAKAYPQAATVPFDQLVGDDGYVAAVWALRAELGEVAEPLFQQYVADQAADQKFVDIVVGKLEALGVACSTSGREFAGDAREADLVVIDLYFNKSQDEAALSESKTRLRKAVDERRSDPPLVILMSRSPRLVDKRDEFRDDIGLLDSAFRIIAKSELEVGDKFERQLERLAENADDSRKLASFFDALQQGMEDATSRTLGLFRKLSLSDVGQIQQLLLNVEGEPAGSYLVDVFDRVLQHEVEREASIIDAAVALNGFSAATHPAPYVAGTPDLQELVARLLSQNNERLRLPGSQGSRVTFGDVIMRGPLAQIDRLRSTVPVDIEGDTAMLVLTPACDLQRNGAPRILLLLGKVKDVGASSWTYGDGARTAAIRLGDDVRWIDWNLKHIDTVSHAQLELAFDNKDLVVTARLREAHALELQQRLLSGLGRVGLVAPMPGTFLVDTEIYYAGLDGIPALLDVPALSDGAVCFVGRDQDKKQVLRLMMTDPVCDGIVEAFSLLPEGKVAEQARKALAHVKSTSDVRRMLTKGLSLKGANATGWFQIPSETGAAEGVQKLGLLAWNYAFPHTPLEKTHLGKAGIIILVKDRNQPGQPGLEDVIRSGLVSASVVAEEAIEIPALHAPEG